MQYRKVQAKYAARQSMPKLLQGNPACEAYPPLLPIEEIPKALSSLPPISPEDRFLSREERLALLPYISIFHQPTSMDVRIYRGISECLRWGILNRNPIWRADPSTGRLSAALTVDQDEVPSCYPNTSGFAIIGNSGVGKTAAVEAALNQYPQVIEHHQYDGRPLEFDQLVWIKFDCPTDGKPKSLCTQFFEAVDSALDTHYQEEATKSAKITSRMMPMISDIINRHCLGAVIVDEIQNLSILKPQNARECLNFFQTINNLGVPVVMVGTPLALKVLQSDFQQSRRVVGQGDVVCNWYPGKDDKDWDRIIRMMWRYQYTRTVVDLTPEIKDAIYEYSVGIVMLAVVLYRLVQEEAILSGDDTAFDASDFQRVANDRMRITRKVREDIRAGGASNLKKYMDLAMIVDMVDGSIAVELLPRTEPYPYSSATEDASESSEVKEAVDTLIELGKDRSTAVNYAGKAWIRLGKKGRAQDIAELALRLENEENTFPTAFPDSQMMNVGSYEDAATAGVVDK